MTQSSSDGFNIFSKTKQNIYPHIADFNLTSEGMVLTSDILDFNKINKVRYFFNPQIQASSGWKLAYSINYHGRSLKTMLWQLKHNSNPYILCIEDLNGTIFGVYFENDMQCTLGRFGMSSTAMFKFEGNECKWYRSTKKNSLYCFSTPNYIAFGCSGNKYGLYLHCNLLDGESNPVETFENDILSRNKEFKIVKLEVWSVLN